jgi:hypothetical protein
MIERQDSKAAAYLRRSRVDESRPGSAATFETSATAWMSLSPLRSWLMVVRISTVEPQSTHRTVAYAVANSARAQRQIRRPGPSGLAVGVTVLGTCPTTPLER